MGVAALPGAATQVRPRQVVQSPPWLVATQQAEPAPLPPLSAAGLVPTRKIAVPVGAWRGTRAAMRSISSSGVRCSSSALAPRLSLVGSLRCLAQRYTSLLPSLRRRSMENGGRAQ